MPSSFCSSTHSAPRMPDRPAIVIGHALTLPRRLKTVLEKWKKTWSKNEKKKKHGLKKRKNRFFIFWPRFLNAFLFSGRYFWTLFYFLTAIFERFFIFWPRFLNVFYFLAAIFERFFIFWSRFLNVFCFLTAISERFFIFWPRFLNAFVFSGRDFWTLFIFWPRCLNAFFFSFFDHVLFFRFSTMFSSMFSNYLIFPQPAKTSLGSPSWSGQCYHTK